MKTKQFVGLTLAIAVTLMSSKITAQENETRS